MFIARLRKKPACRLILQSFDPLNSRTQKNASASWQISSASAGGKANRLRGSLQYCLFAIQRNPNLLIQWFKLLFQTSKYIPTIRIKLKPASRLNRGELQQIICWKIKIKLVPFSYPPRPLKLRVSSRLTISIPHHIL